MDLLDCIPTGHDNAIDRHKLAGLMRINDRLLRRMISETNKNSEDGVLIINMQDGQGYFRPGPGEDYLVRVWMMQEKARGISVEESVDAARRYLSRGRLKHPRRNAVDENQLSLSDWEAQLAGQKIK